MNTTPEIKPIGMGQRLKNSVSMKTITISVLILLLLIPMEMIKSIIRDREQQRETAINEVSNKWAGKQEVTGPILSIPIIYEQKSREGFITIKKHLHILPEKLAVSGVINPKKLKRGIYEVVVYESNLENKGVFKLPELSNYSDAKEIQLNKAFITLGLSDLKGIKNQVEINWNSTKIPVMPGSRIANIINSGVTIPLPNLSNQLNENIPFNYTIKLQGSQDLSFIPIGNTTEVDLKSDWNSPSFFGNFLPDNRNITKQGFDANWKVLQLNRNFSQTFMDVNPKKLMKKAAFGVHLKLPMDDYQKTMRSAKYAILILGLTFLIFFLVEVLNKRKIHPLQYILVGMALCLFYILLVSISEHSNFNIAYLVASFSVIITITLYTISVLKQTKISLLIFVVLAALYGFVFVILQLEDFALLMGSIGLTLILAITMYSTRNINWYNIQFEK